MYCIMQITLVVVSISVLGAKMLQNSVAVLNSTQLFMAVLALYLHSFLELDHERELGEDGQVSLFRHGQLRRL